MYEFGKEIGSLLCTSNKYQFNYCECDSLDELQQVYKKIRPEVIVYNYHPTTMPWIHQKGRFSVPINHQFQSIHIGTIHEVYQEAADRINNRVFDFHVAADPTLMLKNPIVYKTGRLLPQKVKPVKDINKVPVIGSFGFATPGKGFEKIVDLVQSQFDDAIIKLNIPFARFGDTNGIQAKDIAEKCKKRILKESIQLEISHDYLGKEELILFLSSNSINIFLYDDMESRGISSVTDWALASGRPIAISKSRLFRNLINCSPTICVENRSLKSILASGVNPIKHLYDEYSPEVVLREYETMFEDILKKGHSGRAKSRSANRYLFKKLIKKILRTLRIMQPKKAIRHNKWAKEEDKFSYKKFKENKG